jgi:2-aminoethylphosphonate-pyruvate transaminase
MNDKPLFTPGPLTTSASVKQAMLRDLGSRDREFIGIVRDIRRRLLEIAGVTQEGGFEAVLMQGSGTFTVESVISSAVGRGGKLLVVVNGAYGQRIARIARIHGIETVVVSSEENALPDCAAVERTLAADSAVSMVAAVHLETTSGIINPIEEIGRIVARHGRRYFVDSMSAFGAVPIDMTAASIDFLVSSANKCIQGVPGFGFAVCRRSALLETEGRSRTLSLDLLDQWRGLEQNGQFRFTPPTHTILAFRQALEELAAEGGPAGRAERYRDNHRRLLAGMRRLGFREYVPEPLQSYVITSFHYPSDPAFDFETFYDRLSDRGFVIYPGKVTGADCFRIGNVGHLFATDIDALVAAVENVVAEMGVKHCH